MCEKLYDYDDFLDKYLEVRKQEYNYNDLIESPQMYSLLGDLSGKTVLDIGCGYGANTRHIVAAGARYVCGIDQSKKMLNLAVEKNTFENVQYMLLDASDISKINTRFDVVYSSLVFHYIENFNELISDIWDLLLPGGVLLFSQEHPLLTAGRMDGQDISDRGVFVKNYSVDGVRDVEWLDRIVKKYHRKLSTLIMTLIDNGFSVDKIAEPVPDQKMIDTVEKSITEMQRPSFLIIRAVKIEGGEK